MIRESPRAHWYVVATVCIGAFIGQLDASIVTIALPRIGHDLHAGIGSVEWVSLSYLLVLIGAVVPVGHLADAVGRKLLYTYGFGVFTAASALCGLAPSLPVLIAARILQGLGAAMLQANSVALITEAMPGSMLARGIGAQGAAQALGLALGPAIGGALLAIGGWRLIFLVNLPAGVVGLTLGWVLLPRSRSRRKLGSGFGLLPIARLRTVQVGLSSALVSFLVLFGTLFAVPYYLEGVHVSSALAGAELAILPVGIGVTAPFAGRLASRGGAKPLMTTGMLLVAAGLAAIAFDHGTAGRLLGLALAGIGLGAFTPANNSSIMAAAPRGQAGLMSGLLNMTRAAGTGLGVAVAGALYSASGLTLTIAVLGGMALVAGLALAAREPSAQPEFHREVR